MIKLSSSSMRPSTVNLSPFEVTQEDCSGKTEAKGDQNTLRQSNTCPLNLSLRSKVILPDMVSDNYQMT